MAKTNRSQQEELNQIKDTLLQIERIYKKMGQVNPFVNEKAEDWLGNVTGIKKELYEVQDIYDELNDGLLDQISSWGAINDEMKTYKNSSTATKNAIANLTSISEKLKEHQRGINKLSSEDLKTLQSKYEKNTDVLISRQELISNEIINLKNKGTLDRAEQTKLTNLETIYNNINSLLKDNNSILNKTNESLDKEQVKTKQIEDDLGIIGGLMKGISKIPILGDMFDSKKILDDMTESLKHNEGPVKALGAGFKSIGRQIKEGIFNPANMVVGIMTLLGKAILSIDEGAGKIAKSMNITYSEALNVREELTNIANSSGDTAINTQRLQETMLAVNTAVGARVNLNEKDLITFTKLREQAGLSNDQLISMAGFTAINGKSLEKNMSLILKGAKLQALRNNQAINEKQIMEDINQSSTALQLSLGASTEKLAQATVNARKFGLTLAQTEKIAESMLNFESSIENELSAELLIGRNINLEKARGLALNGDTAAAATEIAKQMGSAAEFGRLNVIQQEAMAKAAGMNREELAKSLKDKELLSKFGKDEVKNANEAYQKLVETYGVEEARKQIGNDALANMYEQQSLQERFNDTVAKLQEIFVTVGNALMPIFNLLGGIMDFIGPIVKYTIMWGKWLLPIIAGYQTFKMLSLSIIAIKKAQNFQDIIGLSLGKSKIAQEIILNALILRESIGRVISAAYTSLGPIPIIGIGLAAAAAAVGVGYAVSKMKDGKIDPNKGPIISGDYGSVQIDEKDTFIGDKNGIKVGTDLFGIKNQSSSTNSQSININMNNTNALLQKLITTIEKGGNVTLDGQKVGRALKLGAYKVS